MFLWIAAFLLRAATASAQSVSSGIDALTLQELLDVEVVSTASKFPQAVTRAPASITIITADEIRSYGHRTLEDVLRGVRGFYTTYDRNYSYVGVRGFGRPGDYNTRMLLLVDGHRLNDAVYDQAPIGTDFPFDVSLIDRVEVIRGPGSSLYGTSAFFAVVNIITRSGADRRGVQVNVEGGNLGTGRAQTSFGRLFGMVDVLVAAQAYHSSGANELYYAEYDSLATGNGIVRHADEDNVAGLFSKVSVGRVDIGAAYSRRDKTVPTASFGTIFGDDRNRSWDTRAYLDVQYNGPFGRGWSGVARGGYDHYRYDGDFPYDDVSPPATRIGTDVALSDGLTGEVTLNRQLGGRNMVTIGSETRHYLRADQSYDDGAGTMFEDTRTVTTAAVYVQDELSLTSWLIVNAGARLDRYGSRPWEASPRAGLVFLPAQRTSLKLLYGRAFRSPNVYEQYYFVPGRDREPLVPERITTLEGVWEQYLGSSIRTTVSTFLYDIDGILTLMGDEGQLEDLYFVNAGAAHAHGMEWEVEGRWRGGLITSVSHSMVHAEDPSSGDRLSNSPSQLAKVNAIIPLGSTGARLGTQGRFVGRRDGLRGNVVPGSYVQDANVGLNVKPDLSFSLGVYNLFDRRYGDPGSEEHLQGAIAQDGRTFRARLSLRF